MAKQIKAISVDEIKYLRDKMIDGDDYRGVHGKFKEDDRFYELKFKDLLEVPEDFLAQATVLPTARQLIDVYTDHVDLDNARVTVSQKEADPDNPAAVEKAEQESEILAKFGKGMLYRSNVEDDISQLRVAAKHQGLYGLGCIKDIYDKDRWSDAPEQGEKESDAEYGERMDEFRHERDSQMPIVNMAVNPCNVYPDPSYGGRRFVIEVHEKALLNVRDQYPRWDNPKGRKADERATVTSFWTSTHRCELVDDVPVLGVRGGIAKHNYGFIPYVFIESGLGNLSYDGGLEKRYVGILRYLYGLLISESRNFSLYDVALSKGALPWYTLEGDNADQMTGFKPTYGDAVKLPKGVTLKQQFPDLAPEAVMRQVEIINSMMMAFAAPRATQGLGEQGVRSAVHARTLADLGGVRFQYPSRSFRNKVAKILSNDALIYKNVVPGDMRLWARTPTDEFDMVIDKKKLHPPFTFYVEFAPYSEEKEYTKHDDLERLVKSGLVTVKWARKQMSNVDWKAMEDEDHKNLVAQDPSVQAGLGTIRKAMIDAAIQRKMLEEDIKSTPVEVPMAPQTMQPMSPMGEPGRSVMSPSSPKPMPNSPGAMQNQLQAMRGPSMTGQGLGGGGQY